MEKARRECTDAGLKMLAGRGRVGRLSKLRSVALFFTACLARNTVLAASQMRGFKSSRISSSEWHNHCSSKVLLRRCLMIHRVKTTLAMAMLSSFLAAAGGFAADSASSKQISTDDADFVKAAASGGMMEVQLGKTAQQKASNSQVKEFGRRMQTDHSKANDQLKKIAAKKSIKLPTQLEEEQKSTVDKLSNLKGAEFDRQYMNTMVDDHKEDVKKFQQEADNGKDADVKKFAKDHVPILKKHLELAEQTQKKISQGGK
jgi:putative membrane protein